MKTRYKFLAILSVVLLLSFTVVDFFSSMTKVDYVEGTKTFKFTTKMNSNHISEAIKINPNTAAFEAEVKKYVNNNFDVAINGASRELTFTGSQVNGETVWVYFEIGGVPDMSTMKIKNTILLNAYPKQLNLVNISFKGQQKTMNFQRGKEEIEVSF